MSLYLANLKKYVTSLSISWYIPYRILEVSAHNRVSHLDMNFSHFYIVCVNVTCKVVVMHQAKIFARFIVPKRNSNYSCMPLKDLPSYETSEGKPNTTDIFVTECSPSRRVCIRVKTCKVTPGGRN
jgi:hypothetical protein